MYIQVWGIEEPVTRFSATSLVCFGRYRGRMRYQPSMAQGHELGGRVSLSGSYASSIKHQLIACTHAVDAMLLLLQSVILHNSYLDIAGCPA